MPQLAFRHLDLNLLRVLVAVYRTGSVTEAGRMLALSQPATSNALARLRHFFGDELFVRSPRGMHPTRTTQRIAPAVIAQLQALELMVKRRDAFIAARSDAHWRLSLSDLGEMMFLPPLAQVLRREAPNCRITNVAVTAAQVSAALEARDIDIAIGILQAEHGGIASEILFQERYVAITAREWRSPLGRAGTVLTARQLARASLAVASPSATFHGSVEQMLKRFRLTDRTVLHVRHYGALPELVRRTDLLAIVPEMYAKSIVLREAVRMWDLPELAPRYVVRMLWHQSANGDAAHAWLRALLRRLFQRDASAGDASTGQRPGDS